MRDMKNLWIFLLTLGMGIKAFATHQVPHKIIYNGVMYDLSGDPLEAYFKKYPHKKPKAKITYSALQSGYLATFEVKDHQLFIKAIEVPFENKKTGETGFRNTIDKIFPKQNEVKVDWLSDVIELKYGKVSHFTSCYYPQYECYTLLTINQGNVSYTKHFSSKTYEMFKDSLFAYFKTTDDYLKEIKRCGNILYTDQSLRCNVMYYMKDVLMPKAY
jgi:hypothetical protein